MSARHVDPLSFAISVKGMTTHQMAHTMYCVQWTFGKLPETVGRKVIGTKVYADYVSLTANLISKLSETAGRKAMGTKAFKLRQPGC